MSSLTPQSSLPSQTIHPTRAAALPDSVQRRDVEASTSTATDLPALPIQYADFAVWQRTQLRGELRERQLDYWRNQLAGAPVLLELPTDHRRPTVQSYRGARHLFGIEPDLAGELRALGNDGRTTLFMTLSSAFAVLLGRYSHQDDICIGVPTANRDGHEVEHLIGFFANTVVLRFRLHGDMSFAQLLQQTRETALAAYAHQEMPFEQLVEALQPERHLSHSPLFQVMFTLQDAPVASLDLDGLQAEEVDLAGPAIAKFDLSLIVTEQAGGLKAEFEFNTDLFELGTIERLGRHFRRLLQAIVDQPEAPVAELPLMEAEERQQLLIGWNQTHVALPPGQTIHALFEACVDRHPYRLAAVLEDRSLTYAELNAKANSLAHYLRAQGVGADALVGICADRTLDMVVAVLGVLKAGGAYLPLDPALPKARMGFMIEDAQPLLLLTQAHLLERLATTHAPHVCLDRDAELLASWPTGNPSSQTLPDHLAYVIYTSGSTGHPKGTLLAHRGLVNLVLAQQQAFDLTPDSRVLQWASFNFDASVWDIFTTLTSGAQLHIASPDAVLPGSNLLETLRRRRIDTVLLTPSSLMALPPEPLPELQRLIVGGERCEQSLIEPWLKRYTVINAYGPTEATVCATVHRCRTDGQRHPSIGRPIANTQVYILDACLNPVPIGVSGELYIGGEGLARGYLGRSDLTAERFVQNPFSDRPGARMYKTGDLARFLPDGRIDHIGRVDHQVKIRGYRIELGDIEFALTELPSVQEAVVLAQASPAGGQCLVAYVVPAIDTSADALRAALGCSLPDYMVPAHFVFVDRIPLNTNGKIDRKALDAVSWTHDDQDHAPPRTATEEQLAAIWRHLLKRERVGRDDNFFHVGGHSLAATQLVAQVRKVFGVQLPLRTVFEVPGLGELAHHIDAEAQATAAGEPALQPADRSLPLPLSFAQQRLWFFDRLEPGTALYNMPGAVRLIGELDIGALETAFNGIVARHEVLRTTYELAGDSPVQVVAEQVRIPFALTDLSQLPPQERLPEARRCAEHEAAQGFDLCAAPVLRARLLRLDAREHWLLVTLHHIAADGWSISILVRELSAFYAALRLGCVPEMPPLRVQYADFAAWQRQLSRSPSWNQALHHWREQLASAPGALALPTDRPRPRTLSNRGARVGFTLPPALVSGLHALARRNDATLFMALLGAFGVLLSRYSAQEDLCIGTPVANRRHVDLEDLIGCFVNTLVMRLKLQGNPSFAQLLHQVRDTTLAALANQDLPFEQLVDALQVDRDPSRSPLFQVMFSLHNNADTTPAFDGLEVGQIDIESGVAKFELTLQMHEDSCGLHGSFEYMADLFERVTIERMVGHFQALLHAIVAQPDAPVAQLEMMPPAERRFLLEALDASAHDFPLNDSYATLFASQVALHPDKIAAVCMDEQLSYRSLDERSNRIARALVAAGAGPDVLVGVAGERGLCFLAMIIGIFKAGAAYVPLDVRHPVARLRQIVHQARLPILLASQSSAHLLDELLKDLEHLPRTLLAESIWLDGDASPMPPVGTPNDLAYVIFTSGSTGTPKGAMVERRSMLNNLFGKVPAIGLGAHDRVAQTASPAFDISVWQFLAAPLLGGTVHILPDAVAHDPRRLLDAVADQGISILQLVPSMMRPLLDAAPPTRSPALRRVLSIGEALSPTLALQWFECFPGIPLINIYGPAECADNVAFLAVHGTREAQAFVGLASVPVGHPTANNQLFILDDQLQPVPIGVPGEICVAGIGVGRGYLNDPIATAKAFVEHPFEPGARLYRTGDLGRYRADGAIDYLGRRDHQVKIRGQRIELGEIESRLRACTGVADAAVVARRDSNGDLQVLAYWVPAGEALTADTLRRALAACLPAAMVPAGFVVLNRLPVNANGKVDRKALAALPWQVEERVAEAPATPTEARLHALWAALLGHAQIGLDDNFFHIGGHSLAATQLVAQVHKVFGTELPLRTVFEAPSLRELARHIDAAAPVTQADKLALQPVDRSLPLPLSFAQQRLWFFDQLEPGSALYNIPGGLRLCGPLDTDALEASLNDVVMRHEVLRTTIEPGPDGPLQAIHSEARVPFELIDLTDLPECKRAAQAHHLAEDEAARPFDLRVSPLLRTRLLRLQPQEHWLLLTVHHIAADGWSIGLLLDELAAFYGARCAGATPSLPDLPVQYADFAAWQRQRVQGVLRDQQLTYWRSQLENAPALLQLPTDHPRPAVRTHRGARVALTLDKSLTAALHALSHRAQGTLFMTLSSAFALLLGRYSGQNDVCIGTPVANRSRPEVQHLIGFLVNTLVLRFGFDSAWPFTRLLQHARDIALAAYSHQDFPFEQLVEALEFQRHLGHTPLFQAMFVLQNDAIRNVELGGLNARPLALQGPPVAKFDLTLNITERDGRLEAAFEFNADLFERSTIERLAGHFRTLLNAIVEQPEAPCGELPLLSGQERNQMLVEWNRTNAMLPSANTIHALFEEQVRLHPDAIALEFEGECLSYAMLNDRANRLARGLRARGIGPDDLVGICVDRSLDMVVAVLGVLKAGSAYLPLDPALPLERLNYILQDAGPRLLLTEHALRSGLQQAGIETMCLDQDALLFAALPGDNLPQQSGPNHLAYAIYTSGSTGHPKGTLLHHRGLVNLILAQRDAFGLQPGMRVLQWASFNFDASVSEIFVALVAGARLYLAPSEAVMPGQNLLDTLRRHRIELITLTPSSLAAMPQATLPDLKTLVVAGEHFDHALIAPWVKRYTVINAYGPTEATVCATVYRCTVDGRRHPPIGRPIANTQSYILDAHLNPVPVGVIGELYIGGEGLAWGYLGRPDLTAERFIQNPFSDQPGARMYRTGDLARYLPEGLIEYVGRADHQLKIRGYRIELGEIEFALTQLPGVREAVVLAQDAPAGGKLLVAYVVPHEESHANPQELRNALYRTLPEYMVPAHVALLDCLPVTTNGKVDRKVLAALPWQKGEPATSPPVTATEQQLAALWCELLGCTHIGRDDCFFNLGGHSLMAVRMTARVHEVFGRRVPLSQLFQSRTLAQFAAVIDERTAGSLVVPLKPGQSGNAPLWFIHPAGGTVFAYRQLAEHLPAHRPVHALQSPEIAGFDAGPLDFDGLCRLYLAEVLRMHPAGLPICLGGWSMGGAIALRMAQLLEQAGHTVAWVALFDTQRHEAPMHQDYEEFVSWVRTRFPAQTWGEDLSQDSPNMAFVRQQYTIQRAHAKLMAGFTPGPVQAPLHVFHAEGTVQSGKTPTDWLACTRSPHLSTEQTLAGHHENVILLEPNIERIVQTLGLRDK